MASKPVDEFGRREGQRRVVEHFDAIMALIESGATILGALKSRQEFPSYPSFSTVLKDRPDLAERYRLASRTRQAGPNALSRGADYSTAEIDKAVSAVHRIREGGGHHAKVYAGGPHVATLTYRANRDASLAVELRAALDRRASLAAGERAVVQSQQASFNVLSRSLRQNELYRKAMQSLPRGLDPDVKADVISDIVVAVLEGRLSETEIMKHAREFIQSHYREFSFAMFTSLDGPSARDPDVAIVDTLTTQEFYTD